MPSSNGLFDSFDNLDQIDLNSLIGWIKNTPTPDKLENYLANRVLYPHTLPVSPADIEIDLAILREALKLNSSNSTFLNTTSRKIIIPKAFLNYIPDLVALTWAFVDGLLLTRKRKDFYEDLWTVVLAGDTDEVIGSVLLPQFTDHSGNMIFSLLGKQFEAKSGSLIRIPCSQSHCEISYTVNAGTVLGKDSNAIEVNGGKLGLIIDGRKQ